MQHHLGKVVGGQGILGIEGQRVLIGVFCFLPLRLRFIQLSHQDIEVRLTRVVLHCLLGGGDSLINLSLRGAHLAQFEQGVGIMLVEGSGFLQGSLGPAEVFLVVEQRRAEQIIETTVVW